MDPRRREGRSHRRESRCWSRRRTLAERGVFPAVSHRRRLRCSRMRTWRWSSTATTPGGSAASSWRRCSVVPGRPACSCCCRRPRRRRATSPITSRLECGRRTTRGVVWPRCRSARSPHTRTPRMCAPKLDAVEVALEQATLRSDRAAAAEPGSNEAGEEFARAQRWAIEAERRFEPLADVVDRVRRQATEVGTDWVAVAVDEAVEAWRQARVAARATFELVGMALPPLLHDPEPEPETGTRRGGNELGSGRRQTHRRPAAARSRTAAARCSGVARSSPRCTGSPTATWSRSSPTRRPGNSRRSWCSESTRVWWRWSISKTGESSPDVDEPRLQGREEMEGVRPRRIRRRPRNWPPS